MAESRMVLRSVHLPEEMDEQLRTLAFRKRISKADLVRRFISDGLQQTGSADEGMRIGPVKRWGAVIPNVGTSLEEALRSESDGDQLDRPSGGLHREYGG